MPPSGSPRGDATRDALIAAATAIFARDGFHAASTRAIAEAAGVQQALIGYHFRSKEGLYLAIFEHITRQMKERLGPVAQMIEQSIATPVKGASKKRLRAHHEELLLRLVDNALMLMVRAESAHWAQLIVREQQEPTQAFELVYEGFMAPMIGLLSSLVTSVRGGSQNDARFTVITILGQMLVFRFARAGVLRQLGWSSIGDKELAVVQAHLREMIAAQLSRPPARRRKGKR